MTANGYLQIGLYLVLLALVAKPLGKYMANVLEGKPCGLDRLLGWCERLIYRVAGVDSKAEMTWRRYAIAMIWFSGVGLLALYGLQRMQDKLPLNPQNLAATTPDLAFNTSISFVSNTNWQSYGGETTLSYLTQMLGLTVQNFVSAAMGIAVLAALIRGLARRSVQTIGNFWVDLTRVTLYILVPMSTVLALALVSQGVIQNLKAYDTVSLVQPTKDADGKDVTEQQIAQGPAASQIAIKQLGTNGGGFFNVNSAHPFENPTPLSNFLEMFSILVISGGAVLHVWRDGGRHAAGLGRVGGDVRDLCSAVGAVRRVGATRAIRRLTRMGIDQVASDTQAGGNMEGKEVRFGIANSGLWAAATTAASNGSVNSMHDSYTPLGGLVPMWLMQLGEIVFGGVGSGLYGMLDLRDHRRLRRGADGRPHAGVSWARRSKPSK